MQQTSPNLNLPYLAEAQAQKHITHNEALAQLDVLVQLTVTSFDATSPPANPAEGEVYTIGAGATGDWAGQDGLLAAFMGSGWTFLTPKDGWRATDAATGAAHLYLAGTWVAQSYDNLTGVGINTTSDTTNRLAVASPATLFTHDGAGHQLKINKAATPDTASLLFQTNWSGRAEMGLLGNDAFGIKTSPDGTTWRNALQVDPVTGFVGIGPDADTTKALTVAVNATGPAICIRNTGGIGGAQFELIDQISGGNWRFKTVQDGSFKLRDHGNTTDHMILHSSPRRTEFRGAVQLGQFTVATLPDPVAIQAGSMIYVSDESGGAVIAFSDGTNWRRMTDRAIVS